MTKWIIDFSLNTFRQDIHDEPPSLPNGINGDFLLIE
jgi:hypothetical protein